MTESVANSRLPICFLTLFRIVAVGAIGWYLTRIIKQGLKTGYIVCVSLILTGALGNIIDSVFYGVLFNESTHSQIASFLPEGGGYAGFLDQKGDGAQILCGDNVRNWI